MKRCPRVLTLARCAVRRIEPTRLFLELRFSNQPGAANVHYWLRRYVAQGVSGVLRDASRPGRKKRITPAQVAAIVNATLTTTPPGRTHGST